MKIMTIVGTRPEIIRLSRVIPLLDSVCQHVLVHTGQNYTQSLNDIFFQEMGLRKPDYMLSCQAGFAMEQIGLILRECEQVILRERPDRLLILGDTNSALSAMIARRTGIPVFHMEAGNRCHDHRVPEEVNRRIVDHCSDILLPYTERSRQNLLKEGIAGQKILVTGNPIYEVLNYYKEKIEKSTILETLGLEKAGYFLVTLHRSENVDIAERLASYIEAFQRLHLQYGIPVICSMHPRTRSQLTKQRISLQETGIVAIEPVGLFDFVSLEKQARCVLSDSGTVQEECCIFRVPNVTLRDVTERPETVEAGSSILSGCEAISIINAVKMVTQHGCGWNPPQEYLSPNVSQTVIKIILGKIPA